MKNKPNNLTPLILFSDISTIDLLIKAQISKKLHNSMAIYHLTVLNKLSSIKKEKTRMQLAKSYHVTKCALTYSSAEWRDCVLLAFGLLFIGKSSGYIQLVQSFLIFQALFIATILSNGRFFHSLELIESGALPIMSIFFVF